MEGRLREKTLDFVITGHEAHAHAHTTNNKNKGHMGSNMQLL